MPRREHCTLIALLGHLPSSVIPVTRDTFVLGRGRAADVCVDDRGLSRAHARIFKHAGSWFAEDLGSTNGTFVAGQRLTAPRRLADGDRIQMGRETLFKVSLTDSMERDTTKRLYESSIRDPLTRLHNRGHLDERLLGEHAYASRHETPLTVLIVDVDHFKRVNDTFGHLAGDVVLRVMAATIQRMVRAEDLVARYGGEEFVVVARGIDARNGAILAERVRKLVEGLTIPWEDQTIGITVSIGVATWTREHPHADVQALLAAADGALYAAKAGGRNRCCAG